MFSKPTQSGPDPEILKAVSRLNRTELTPLEETMFQAWTTANQLEDNDEGPDLRKVYKDSGGKVLPPGQLKNDVQRKTDIDSIMKAQEAHDSSSPIQALMSAREESGGDGSQNPPAY